MQFLEPIDCQTKELGDLYDELPLWSAHFGLLLLEQVTLRPGLTILDMGAGTGFLTIELAQRCGASAQVIAVDPWEAAQARLTRKLRHLGLTNVRTLVQDVVTLDLPNDSVDLLVSNLGLNNFDRPQEALRTCHRVARPGAALFLTTNLAGHLAEFYEAYRQVLVELGFHERLPVLEDHIRHRPSVESVQALLESTGFEFVAAATSVFHERFVDGSSLLRHYFMRLGFVPGWKSVAPPGEVERTFAALERRLNEIAAARGELSLSVPAACIHARKPGAA